MKSVFQIIKEDVKQDTDPKAVYLASEINLLDKSEENVKSGEGNKPTKGTQSIEKTRKALLDKYKSITGHIDTKKSIPESKMHKVISIFEGMLEDLDIKDLKEFGSKYKQQIKDLVAKVGGNYIGYKFDVPTGTIEVITDKGSGQFYFYPEDDTFEEFKIQSFYK